MKYLIIAASALALLITTSVASAAATPTRLWYKLSIVYIGEHRSETIGKDGAKGNIEMHAAYTGRSDTAVLVRKEPYGRFTVRSGPFSGRLTRLEWDYKQDWFMGSVAPCKEHTHEGLAQPVHLTGAFGADPAFRRGHTSLGAFVEVNAPTRVDRFAVAPCAGSIRGRPVELLNQAAVGRGEPPQYLVKGSVDDDVETSPSAMLRIPADKRKFPEGRTVGDFGKQAFSIVSHLVVRYGPKYIGGVIDSYSVDETWFFNFSRCPGTAPC